MGAQVLLRPFWWKKGMHPSSLSCQSVHPAAGHLEEGCELSLATAQWGAAVVQVLHLGSVTSATVSITQYSPAMWSPIFFIPSPPREIWRGQKYTKAPLTWDHIWVLMSSEADFCLINSLDSSQRQCEREKQERRAGVTALTWALACFPEDITSENRVGAAFLLSFALETLRQLHLLPDTQRAQTGKHRPVCSVWSPADKPLSRSGWWKGLAPCPS